MGKRKHKKRKATSKGSGARRWFSSRKLGTEVEPMAPGLLAWCNRYGLYVAIGLAVVYAVAFCAISHYKYRHFNYDDYDMAIFANAMWNTAHGHFMFTDIRDGCYFKDHVPVILLALVPLYRLFPSPLTLLYAQAIMLGAGAVPLFLLARREINGLWGILFALMYLLYPAVGFINLFEFHDVSFVPVLLLFAFYFFRLKRYVPFLVFAGLGMLCREEVSLTVMMIGVYALIARRRWQWIVAPAAAGLVWFLICMHVIIPHFNKGENIFGRLYGEMGTTPAEVIKNIITKPGMTLRIALKKDMRPGRPPVDKPGYLGKVFTPVSYLALANPEALLITAPQFALNLLVDTNMHAPPPTIYFQYTGTLIPVLFFSSVLGLARLLRVRVLRQFWFIPMAVVALISATTWVMWSPQLAPRKGPPRNIAGTHVRSPDDGAQYRELLDAVPEGVPVVATFRFLDHLTDRHVVTSFHDIYMGHEKVDPEHRRPLPDEVSHMLLDLQLSEKSWGFGQADSPDIFYRLLESGDWGVEKRLGQLVLLRKNAPELPKLVRRIEAPERRVAVETAFGGVVKVIGAEADRDERKGAVQVRIATAWEVLEPLLEREHLLVDFYLIDAQGRIEWNAGGMTAQGPRPAADLGQFALWPHAWKRGDRFAVEHAVLVPDSVPDGTYTLAIVVQSSVRGPLTPSGGVGQIARLTLGDKAAP